MKNCLQNFPVFSFLGHFFGMILYIWPFANVYSCRKSLRDTISERHLPAFCKFFSFQKFVSRKFLPSWYWMLSCLFGYCFSLNNLLERFYFNSFRNSRLFDARQDWPIGLPISVKIRKCRAFRFDLEVDYFRWKIFSKEVGWCR